MTQEPHRDQGSTARWGLGIALASVLILAGCSGGMGHGQMSMGSTQGVTSSFAFVANSGSANISVFAIDTTGALSPVAGSPFAAGAGAEFMALDSVHKLLFVANQNANSVSAFSINTGTGALTPVPGSPFGTGQLPHGIAVDPAGKFVFVGNQNDNSVSAFSINPQTGALAAVSGSPFGGIDGPFGVAVNPAGTLLFVTNINANTVSAFRIDAAGALASSAGQSFATGQTPIAITADHSGKFLFVGDHMQDSVSAYSINSATGALARTSGPVASTAQCSASCHVNPLRIAIDPADRFAYVANVGANTLSAFGLNDGNLTPVSSSLPTGQHPFGVALDFTGRFLYVVNKVDGTISAFSVTPNSGMVASLPGSPFGVGGNSPTGIVIVPKQ